MLKFEDGDNVELTNQPRGRKGAAQSSMDAIFKVAEVGYIPKGVRLRSKIDGEMFTGSFPAELEAELRLDSKIVSIALNQRLQKID